MKKFFSIFAALLFAGSMMAVTFTLSSADAVTVEGVTVTFAKGDGNNPPAWYDNGLRLYGNNTVTVSSESAITAITFNWQQQGSKAFNTATASVGEYTHPEAAGEGKWTGSATSVTFTLGTTGQLLLNTFTVTLGEGEEPVEPTMDYYVAGSMTNWGPMAAYKLAANPANEGEYMGEFTFAANDEFKVGYSDGTTIESTNYFPNGMDNNYVITEAGDYTVYFRPDGQGGEDWHEGYIKAVKVETPVLADPTNCAEAAEAALSVSANNELYNNGASYTITGYVTSIAYAWKEGSMSFWMADTENGGNVLEAYKCAIANEADAVLVGDKVAVTGQLTKFNSTPEFAAGCTVEILQRAEAAKNLGEKTIAEFLALKNTKDTCILTGVVANIQNEEYGNFDLVDETGSVYIFGLLTPEGEAKKFAELGVEDGDTLTVLAIYSEYKGAPQVKNAIFVDLVKGEGGGSEGEYSYDYEPDEALTFNVEMSTAEIEDYTADYGIVTMSFESADGSYFASMELIISSADLLVPGAYQISDSEEEGTFYASPGGDEQYDYGCYFGVTYIDPEDSQEYYNPYYLVSGNVTITETGIQVQAKSYKGSTVNFTYVEPHDAVVNTKLTDKLLKAIENGNVIIKSGNVIFNVNGQRIK